MTRLTIAVCALIMLCVAGCGPVTHPAAGGPTAAAKTHPATPTAAPASGPLSVSAAQAAAQAAFNAAAAGNWAAAWALYTDEGQAAISKADYVRLNTACPGDQGIPGVVQSAQLESPGKAVVTVSIGGQVGQFTMDYEHGSWRIEPTAAKLAEYQLGVSGAIARRKAEGICTVQLQP